MNIKAILAVIAILGALGWAGHGDAIDERQQFKLYCLSTFGPDPIWPDYQNVGLRGCQEDIK